MRKSWLTLAILAMFLPVLFMGCEGDDGAPGAKGEQGLPGPGVGLQVEQCVICHSETGTDLHALYQELYQDGVIQVTGLNVEYTAPNIVTTTFTMTKDGVPFDCKTPSSIAPAIYWVAYTDNNTFEMPDLPPNPGGDRFSLKPSISTSTPAPPYQGTTTTVSNPATGLCTVTGTYNDNIADFTGTNGLVVLYGADEQVGSLPARIRQVKYPYEALLETGAGVAYESAANNAGCEKCHSVPFLKHGYIAGQANGDPATDFWACKACHLDNGSGGHLEWQLSVDDPPLWVQWMDSEDNLTDAQKAKYAYSTRLMNDVHMSHAMEFPYPQSMSNCVVCHEGKLDLILTDDNFKGETCKSCHPVNGSTEYSGGIAGAGYMEVDPDEPWARPAATATYALANIMPPTIHGTVDQEYIDTTACNSCHDGTLPNAPLFSEIHTGYDKKIYAVDNNVATKYSDAIMVTIDNASFADNTNLLTFAFSATGTAGGLLAEDITPTVLVGLYGWGTKDYIVGPHERSFDDNGDGVVDGDDARNLEYVVGRTHPRFETVSAGGGSWEVTADLSSWADLIATDNVTKVEIAVMPALENPDFVNPDNTVGLVALDAPSKTFDLGTKKFVVANNGANSYFQGANAIVRVETGCNECHGALATTFHSPDRGGNIVVCRLCHITKSGGSHLEMQSRSIDSYAHAIHSMQAFDIGDIDFSDPVYALHYEEHIEFPYPKHGITDCESCHNAGKYNAPNQAKSMPGLLSASDRRVTVAGVTTYKPVIFADGLSRNIGDVPEYVTGPGSRACGSCHRAVAINEDNPGELDVINSHVGSNNFGYLIENKDTTNDTDLYEVIYTIMGLFP